MLNKQIYNLINSQINKELYSAYLYLEISNYFNEHGLPGFASWYVKQSEEEVEHAMKFNAYVYQQGGKVVLEAIEKPVVEFKNAREALEAALEHEKKVTAWINDIYAEAVKQGDFRTQKFLDWFIAEQTEEEENADEMIAKYDLASKEGSLYLLNKELGKRD